MAREENPELESAWLSVRDLALRDFSQDASLHRGAATALGTKSQPAGGIPLPPVAVPVAARTMGSAGNLDDVEGPMRFGFHAAIDAGPSGADWNGTVEERLRVQWEGAAAQRRDWEHVKPFVRHGWAHGRKRIGFGL